MKKLILLFFLLLSACLFAQVGINTTTPNAQLDIRSSNQGAPTATDGMLIPKMDSFPAINPTIAQQGMLVYLTTTVGSNTPGFYYWDNPTSTWIPVKGKDGGTLDEAYNFGGAGAGRIITADAGALLINGTDGLVSTGTSGSGAVAPSGSGTRMVWNPRKRAFRAGRAISTQWDDVNVGDGSIAFGESTTANGSFSTAFGRFTTASGFNATAFGLSTVASGSFSIAFGASAVASGQQSFALGTSVTASGSQSTAFGGGTISSGFQSTTFGFLTTANATRSTSLGDSNNASSYGETVLGIGATTYTPGTNGATQFRTANATDRLFVIGNAIDTNNNNTVDDAERSDAMIVLKNGLTRLPSTTNTLIDAADGKAVVTKEWVNTNAISTAWGLSGNGGTNPSTHFIGTSDNNDLVFRTNNVQQALFTATGKSIFGNAVPSSDTWAGFSKTIIGTNDADNDFTLRSSGTDTPAFNILRSNGTMASPTEFSGGELGSIRFWRYSGTGGFEGYVAAGRIVSGISSTGASNLILSGAQASHVIITNTGNVGVGTSTPLERLHISGRSLFTNGFSTDNAALLYQNNTDYMFIGPQSGSSANGGAMALYGNTNAVGGNAGGVDFNVPNGQIRMNHTGGNYVFRANSTSGYTATFEINDQGLQIGHNSASRAILFNTSSTERMRLTQIGRLGIGTPTPGGQFELSLNEARKPGTNTWTIVSDRRLKNINGSYKKGLNEILQLNPISYNYKNNDNRQFEKDILETEFVGFIAQEVQPHFPEAIGTDEDGFLNFNIHPILIASINAIKEQQTIIIQQKEEINLLKQQLQEQYKSILERLEKIENN